MEKTNVMRLLDAKSIPYEAREYDPEITSGPLVAAALGEDPDTVFKTLVTEGPKKEHFVFVIPVNAELDLKKAAKAARVKSIAMIPQKELLPLTGYIHGGCSPFGMKKPFPTFLDETAELFPSIFVSAGRRGYQVGISPSDIVSQIGASFADLTVDHF
ncbi:MAG: Cys-tRNA(Pro) deacylase [Bacillales bacterium]|nr:Cys-tRNA(Pro) deacylase [Bacillales bacterium]MDY5919974.1 Cys-tRNA(Pro) deacylase [Candidatus Enteromonas sp.]